MKRFIIFISILVSIFLFMGQTTRSPVVTMQLAPDIILEGDWRFTGDSARFSIPIFATAPTASLRDGQMYYNSGTDKFTMRKGGAWASMATGVSNPSTTTINQILYSSSDNVVAGLATANYALLQTGATGVPVWGAITQSRALATDVNGTVGVSATTSTELGYVSGVSSAIQTQMNLKAADADVLKKDGSVALTSNWDAGGFEIKAQTLESDVATSIPPLTVASTTKVDNLNADLLDGEEASAFQDTDPTLTALAGLTIADVSIIEGTGADAVSMVASGGNNYILGSNAANTALEFKVPTGSGAPVLATSPTFITSIDLDNVTAGIIQQEDQGADTQAGRGLSILSDDGGTGTTGGAGGDVTITGGDGKGSGDNDGGSVLIEGGALANAGAHGDVILALNRGNVGIGTVGPAFALDVAGQGRFNTATGPQLILTDTEGADSTSFDVDGDGYLTITPTGGKIILPDAVTLQYDAVPASDDTWSGHSVVMTVGENVAYPDLLYMKDDGKLWKADANAVGTMPAIFVAGASISADDPGVIIMSGSFLRDDDWTWTVGGIIYASGTSGGMTQSAPSTVGDQVQAIGVATHADRMFLFISPVLVEVGA